MSNEFVGTRKEGFKTSHIIGIAGGIAGGLSAYAEGSSAITATAGAVVGGAVGYAVGKVMGIGDDVHVASRIMGGAMAGVSGLGFAGITTGVLDSIMKIGSDKAE